MKLLLDTHVFLWWQQQAPKLGSQTVRQMTDPLNEIFVSAVSVWEIAIKRRLGKLVFHDSVAASVGINASTRW